MKPGKGYRPASEIDRQLEQAPEVSKAFPKNGANWPVNRLPLIELCTEQNQVAEVQVKMRGAQRGQIWPATAAGRSMALVKLRCSVVSEINSRQ